VHLSVYGNVPLFLTDDRAVSFATVGLTFCKYSSGSIWVVRRFRFIQNSGWVRGGYHAGHNFEMTIISVSFVYMGLGFCVSSIIHIRRGGSGC